LISSGGEMDTNNSGQNGCAGGSASDEAVNIIWQQCCKEHIRPSRLFRLAVMLAEPVPEESNHLEWCNQCRAAFDRYRSTDPLDDGTHFVQAEQSSPVVCAGSATLHNRLAAGRLHQAHLVLDDSPKPTPQLNAVPDVLRKALRVKGPVIFPNGHVAFDTWQLGRIESLSKTDPALAETIADLVVNSALSVLLPRLGRRNIVLVCFGRSLHRLGTRLASRLVEQGFTHLHVVLAHDFYSPTLVCAPKELRGADVTVMVDVVHTGGLLDRLFSVCREHSPAYVRGLTLIDQSSGERLSEESLSLWNDAPEERFPVEHFLQTAPIAEQRELTRFEPNDECAVDVQSASRLVEPVAHHVAPIDDCASFAEMIHQAGAFRCDYSIGHKRYPYVINVLDLLRDSDCRQRLLALACERLADLNGKRSCVAYHAGRAARAGRIAKLLGAALNWPVIALGSGGPSFALSQPQYNCVTAYQNVVLVDAAIRTGESLTAMTRALADSNVCAGRRIVGFCVLDALSRVSREELATTLGIEIRTLFRVPLAPPTERVRNWMSSQKVLIHDELMRSGHFAEVESLLRKYCEHVRRPTSRGPDASLDQTRSALEKASWESHLQERAVEYIGTACKEGKVALIRHLPLDQVVHDRSVQSLLMGVMYNSMKPSFKESAVFALAAARNYDWMTYEWLQCNRPFLGSPTNSWKSVLMIECKMKLDDRVTELAIFRDALKTFGANLPECRTPVSQLHELQQPLPFDSHRDRRDTVRGTSSANEADQRLKERLNVMLDVAG
jgi:hypothetical protein